MAAFLLVILSVLLWPGLVPAALASVPSGSFLGIAPLCFLLYVALCQPTAQPSAQCPPVRHCTPTPDYGPLGPVTSPGQIALSRDLSPFLNCSPCGLNCLPSAVLMITDCPTDPRARPEHRGLTCVYNARASCLREKLLQPLLLITCQWSY